MNNAFILKEKPVILKKYDEELGKEVSILFFAYETYFPAQGPICPSYHRYTIRYYPLNVNKNNQKLILQYPDRQYYGYALTIKKLRDSYSAQFHNHTDSKDHISMDYIIFPKGIGIGSIILNHLLLWGKQNYAHVEAPGIILGPADEIDPVNKLRRNALYEGAGLIKKTSEGKYESTYSLFRDLSPNIHTKGFSITGLTEELPSLYSEVESKQQEVKKLEKARDYWKKEERHARCGIFAHWAIGICNFFFKSDEKLNRMLGRIP